MEKKILPFIDLHQDIADNCQILTGKDFFVRNALDSGSNEAGFPVNNQVDIFRLFEGGAKMIFGASCPFALENGKIVVPTDPFATLKKQLDFYLDLFKQDSRLKKITSSDAYKNLREGEEIGILMHVEGADFLADSSRSVRELYDIGVRSIGLTHNEKNALAGGAKSDGELTKIGQARLEEIKSLGMIFDLAHLNEKSFWQALEIVEPPLMCSHCGIDYIKKDARNLSDRQLKAVCSKDGLVGIAFTPSFFNSNSSEELVATFRYLKKKIGTDHLAIGSDFDGIIAPKLFPELSEVSQMQNLRNILKKAGYLTREIEKVFSINVEEKLINRLR